MARADELQALLLRGLALEQGEVRLLDGVLGAVADLEEWLDVKAAKTGDLLDPEQVPDELVPYLAAIVGVGDDLDASQVLTVEQQRALIPVAVGALWKRKGTLRSWRSVVRYLGGVRALVLDWFYRRIIQGSAGELHVIPAPGTAPGGPYDNPEFVSDVWLMDPDGSAPTATIARWLEVVLPANERINLYSALLVEDLQVGASLWDATIPNRGRYVASLFGGPALVVFGGGALIADDAIPLPLTGTGRHWFLLFAVHTTAEILIHCQDTTGDDCYAVEITNTTGPGLPGQVRVLKYTAGAPAVLATWALPQALVDDFNYRWSVDAYAVVGGTEIAVLWEAFPVGTVQDLVAAYTTGRPGFRGGSALLEVGALRTGLFWEHNPARIRVGLNP